MNISKIKRNSLLNKNPVLFLQESERIIFSLEEGL